MATVNPTPSSVTHTNPVVKQIKDSAGNVYDIHDEQAVHYLDSWDKVPGSTYIWGENDPATWVNTNKKTTLGDIADELEWAKSQIEAITGGDAVVFKGVTTVALTDLGNETPSPAPAGYVKSTGDLWFYNREQFIYGSDSKWHSLGPQLNSLGALAYADTASTTYKPSGTVSQPTFNGTQTTLTVKGITAGTVGQPTFNGAELTSTGTYTPGGTVSKPTFSGTPTTLNVAYDKTTDVSQPTFNGTELTSTGTYTPAGTVTKPTFNGTPATLTVPDVPETIIGAFKIGDSLGNIEQDGAEEFAYNSYTPSGTISKPNITVTNSTKAINTISGRGTLPTFAAQVENEILQFNWTTGALPTTASSNVTTGVSASLAANPTFTGNATTMGIITGYTDKDIEISYTPAGSVTQPSFNGTLATITVKGTPAGTVTKPTLTHTVTTAKVSYTPAGTVSQPSFTGTPATITVTGTPAGTVTQPTFSGAVINSTVAYKPAGTVTQPTFSGATTTITVTPD